MPQKRKPAKSNDFAGFNFFIRCQQTEFIYFFALPVLGKPYIFIRAVALATFF
ncbi:hypothetical protein [Niastella vici]|uniref:hypothetical protein n=1 Tax=Niastella vici TaxID=1703345 RepID=UPI001301EBC0|nr:hypothetical protein [Niastella vici]